MIEFYRYRCFLLGLPEELLPADPQDIVDMFHVRGAPCETDSTTPAAAWSPPRWMPIYDRPTDCSTAWPTRWRKSYSKAAFCGAFCDFNPGPPSGWAST